MLGCVAEKHPNLPRAVVEAGHELASHGYAHFKVGEQDPETFLADVTRTKTLLEDLSGQAVQGYRAASFSITRDTWWAFDALAEAGYRYSSSLHPIRHDHYGMPDAPRRPFQPCDSAIREIPVATVDWHGRRISCAGGGHFRLLPYLWSRTLLRRINGADRQSAVFYFHPWEIDPGQPRSKLRRHRQVRVDVRPANSTLHPHRLGPRATNPKTCGAIVN